MRRTRGRTVDISSLPDLDRRLATGVRSLAGWHVRDLDLRDRGEALAGVDVAGAVFVSCLLADESMLRERGAVVLTGPPAEVPVDAERSSLYTARELYDARRYADSLDARVFAWSRLPRHRDASLAMALHDHAIDTALEAWVRHRRLVGVMGGHALTRDSQDFAAAARLGHRLGATYVVATGGGPGAMEAANLGALLSREDPDRLDEALLVLARVPSYQAQVGPWVDAALEVVGQVADPTATLGIPTWHYGHEPSNAFATAIAKYFRNATREAVLLQVCAAGIVFLPGAAGTVQEVFQDACENYYADASSLAPMVLVGRTHWTETVPAWPLLRSLARGRAMEPHVHLVDTLDEAAAVLAG